MIGSLYLPGNTWLHRAPPGRKLAVLALVSTALMWVHSFSLLLVACVLVCLSVRWAGASLQQVWQQLRPLVWLLVVLGGLSVWSHGVFQALEMRREWGTVGGSNGSGGGGGALQPTVLLGLFRG